jgi:hypothetical protein
MEIQIGEKLDMQKGTMICTAPGVCDAYVVGADGKLILKQAGVTITPAMANAWISLKEKQAAHVASPCSATL